MEANLDVLAADTNVPEEILDVVSDDVSPAADTESMLNETSEESLSTAKSDTPSIDELRKRLVEYDSSTLQELYKLTTDNERFLVGSMIAKLTEVNGKIAMLKRM